MPRRLGLRKEPGRPIRVLVAPGRASGLRAMTCERIVLPPGAQPLSLRLEDEEQVGYLTIGHGLLTTAGGRGRWTYPVEQGTAFWLGSRIDCSIVCTGEAPVILARFRYREKETPPTMGLQRRIVVAHEIPAEVELGRHLKVLFRGAAVGSGTLVTAEEATYSAAGASPVHRAVGMEEVFYFVRGRGRVKLGHRVVRVKPGDAVAIPSGIFHNVAADRGEILRHVTCNILI